MSDDMVFVKYFNQLTASELYEILRAREEVFFLEQKVDCEDIDGVDPVCTHMWTTDDDGCIAGYLRIIPAGGSYEQPSIGRMLVREQYRRQGISRRMMLEAMEYIREEWGATEIMISAQSYLVDFYASLGFEVVSEEYPDGGIPHRKMLYRG